MKTSLGLSVSYLHRRAAFTLIELLTVMAIILVLAGLIINIAGSASYNSAKARATGEIHAISTALESYKADNGTYPLDPNSPPDPTGDVTKLLNAQANFEPTNTIYIINSQYLYQVLSGFPVTVGNNPSGSNQMSKAYMTFTKAQLQTASSGTAVSPTSPQMYLIDPFGFSYGYSTIYAQYVSQQTATGNNNPNLKYGYNPTFDLWSTAGYASGGKSLPSPTPAGSPATVYSSLWIKNW